MISERQRPEPRSAQIRADPRQAAVERAIRALAVALQVRTERVAAAVAGLADAAASPAGLTPRELLDVARRSQREAMLAELRRYEQEGHGRASVMLVARKFARDPVEVQSVARKLRRWRPKKNGRRPFATLETS